MISDGASPLFLMETCLQKEHKYKFLTLTFISYGNLTFNSFSIGNKGVGLRIIFGK